VDQFLTTCDGKNIAIIVIVYRYVVTDEVYYRSCIVEQHDTYVRVCVCIIIQFGTTVYDTYEGDAS